MKEKLPVKVEHNLALELINSLSKYVSSQSRKINWNTPDIQKDIARDIVDLTPNPNIKSWLEHVNNTISPMLKNDLLFLCGEDYHLLNVAFYLIEKEHIREPLDLIEAFKNIDLKYMIEVSYVFYDLEATLENKVQLEKELLDNFPLEVANSFMHYVNNPLEYRNNFASSLEAFYYDFFKPLEEKLTSFMKDRLLIHNKVFKEDPMVFVNTIGHGDYEKAIGVHDKTVIYMSYFLDIGLMFYTYVNSLILICGQNIEIIFEEKTKQDRYKALFKALSDDKRISILKLTSERPWYNKELADYFHLTPATLSYHLNLLLNLGILDFEPSILNNRYYYTTNKDHLKRLFSIALKDLLNEDINL